MRIENGACEIVMDVLQEDRDTWLRRRRMGIGGSDASALLGLNPWRSTLAVAVDKKGLGASDEAEATDAMRFGTRMEEPILQWFVEDFQQATGRAVTVKRSPYMYASVPRPWQLANIDGVVWDNGELGGIEIKTHDRFALKDYGTDAVPAWVLPQVYHYMAVTDLPFFYVVALIGRKLLWRRVEWDEAEIQKVIYAETDFYERFMMTDDLPPPSGLDCDDDIIKALYGLSDSDAEVNLAEDSLLAQQYVEAVETEKAAAAKKQCARQTIQMHMGTAKYAACGDYRAVWTRFQQTRIDLDLLRQEQPDVAQRYSNTSLATRFSVKEVK